MYDHELQRTAQQSVLTHNACTAATEPNRAPDEIVSPQPAHTHAQKTPTLDHYASQRSAAIEHPSKSPANFRADGSILGAEQLERMHKKLGQALVRTVAQIRNSQPIETSGILYPSEYKKLLSDRGAKPNPDDMTGRAPHAYFEKFTRMGFRVRPRVSASAALQAFLDGPTVAECATVMLASQYAVIRDAIGAPKFDRIFGSAEQDTDKCMRMRLDLAGIGGRNPIRYFVGFTDIAKSGDVGEIAHRPARIGEHVYIGGVPDYARKHPAGAGGGENVVYCGRNVAGEQVFHEFSLAQPMTETEICSLLVCCFNDARSQEDLTIIESASRPSNFDLELHQVPEKVSESPAAAQGFKAGHGKFFKADAVLRAVRDPVEVTIDAMEQHAFAEAMAS